jgi:pilus assembly protein CpaE
VSCPDHDAVASGVDSHENQPESSTMKDLTRIVLVDPLEESRTALQRLLGGITTVWLSEVLSSYQEATARAAELAAHLTIVVLDHDSNQAADLIQRLAAGHPEAVVLPASRSSDSGLILKAIRAGAREFLTLPAEPAELLDTIARLLRGRNDSLSPAAQGARIVTITGAAGGVGCTTLAVNLATTLAAAKEQEAILLDLDLLFGSVDAYLDIPPDHTLSHVVQNVERLDLTLLKRSLARHASGLYVLPHPVSMEEAAAIDPETLRRFFGLLRAAFSTVVIDASKGLQSSDFTAFEMSHVILVVVQLDLVCLRNTARLIALFHQYDGFAERIKLVVNRSGSFDSEISLKKAEETLKMPISWQIPNAARHFQEARIKGAPLGDVAKGSRPHQVFLEIAGSLRPAAVDQTSKPRKGLFAAFF